MKRVTFFSLLIIFMFIHGDAKKYNFDEADKYLSKYEKYPRFDNYKHHNRKSHEKFHKRHNFNVPPPDHKKYIAMARYVVHQSDWTSIATISTASEIKGFPFTNIVSMSDGAGNNSTGIPYFYLTPLDFTSIDLQKDNRCSVSVTLEETDYCDQHDIDPEDPRCARVILTGRIIKVDTDSSEYEFAKNALFTRHPSLAHLPADHHFYVAKLKIMQIALLDWFGGPKFINIQDYLNFKPDDQHKNMNFLRPNRIQDDEIMAIQF